MINYVLYDRCFLSGGQNFTRNCATFRLTQNSALERMKKAYSMHRHSSRRDLRGGGDDFSF